MMVIEMGYKSYVVTTEQALAVASVLDKAEIYERKYLTKEERSAGGVEHSHHVYPNEEGFTLRTLSESLYQMAKLAGKPTKEK